MYFTVTAYTADGLESVTSNELVVATNLPSDDGSSLSRMTDSNRAGSL
jgi:hypothetical protein